MVNMYVDVDGVLTPKVGGIQITTQMDQQAIHDAIANAPPSKKGFIMLNVCMGMLSSIYGWKDALNHLYFPTGRKQSEYEHETQDLFFTGLFRIHFELGNHTRVDCVKEARAESLALIKNVIWYPEELPYDKDVYYNFKFNAIDSTQDNLANLDLNDRALLYFEDDAELITYLETNRSKTANFAGLECIHFEG